MATVSTPLITESTATDNRHHSNMDKSDFNMHLPVGFRSATVGDGLIVSETGDYSWEQSGLLPPALDYADSSASAPSSTSGDVYLLDDNSTVFTITSILWQSGTTVRYTFSGSPDLSSFSTVNNVGYFYGTGITNSEHIGRFVLTTINDGSDYVEVTNAQITDNSLDETGLSNSSAELPHSDWNGASNGDWVRHNGSEYFRINPIEGAKCYDKTLLQTRTWNGTKWLGDYQLLALAFSDETTNLTTGTAKITFHMPYKILVNSVIVTVTTAPTGATLTVDLNDDGTSIFSTVVTIDATEKTSSTASIPAVIDSTKEVIAKDSLMTVDIDQIGSTIAGSGAKIYIIGHLL